MIKRTLRDFISESNAIEGIMRPPTDNELQVHQRLLALPELSVLEVERFVDGVQPGARLRIKKGDNVRVGSYYPPNGDIVIKTLLEDILKDMVKARMLNDQLEIYNLHHRYERLHPFMDGNGRSGRALWLWCQDGYAPLGFLHQWYYDTLRYGKL